MTIIFKNELEVSIATLVSHSIAISVPRVKERVEVLDVTYKVVRVTHVIRNHATSEISHVNEPVVYVELKRAR